MAQNLHPDLLAHLAGGALTLAMCWRLSRRDGVVLAFTDHARDLVIDGETYQARSGFLPSAFSGDNRLSVNNLELQGFLRSEGITDADISAGLLDGALVEIFAVNYQDLPPDLASNKIIWVIRGYLGEIRNEGADFYNSECRGLSQVLQQTVGDVTSQLCRYNFGDSRCTKNLAAFTHTGTVTNIQAGGRRQFTVAAFEDFPPPYFVGGRVTINDGPNAGAVSEVVRHLEGGNLTLLLPLATGLQIGDSVTAVAGCNKSLDACRGYDNVINFGGEPHLPGNDRFRSGRFS